MPVNHVPVHIDVIERVVGHERVVLCVGFTHYPVVPEADVLNGGRLRREIGRRRGSTTAQVPGDDIIEILSLAGHRDVVSDVTSFAAKLARLDHCPLHRCWVDHAEQHSQNRPASERNKHPPHATDESVQGQQQGGGTGQDGQDPVCPPPSIHIGVARAEDHAPV